MITIRRYSSATVIYSTCMYMDVLEAYTPVFLEGRENVTL